MTQGSSGRSERAAHNREVVGSSPTPATPSKAEMLASTIRLVYPGVDATALRGDAQVRVRYGDRLVDISVELTLQSEAAFSASMNRAMQAIGWPGDR